MIMEDITSFGLGTTSLLVDYARACIKHVTHAINDEAWDLSWVRHQKPDQCTSQCHTQATYLKPTSTIARAACCASGNSACFKIVTCSFGTTLTSSRM
jgi:hypothetical protein